MFGSSNTTPFGSSGTSNTPFGGGTPGGGFGAPAPAPFGSSNTTAFGTGPTTTFGGAPAPAAPTFGATTTTGAFGAPAAGGAFGNTPNTTTTAFGGGSAFGAPATSSTPFGSPPAPAPGLFGAPAPAGGMFGGATGGFGAPAPAPANFGGGFGSTASAPTSAFGAPAATFGSPAPGLSFGSPPAAAPTSAFGAPAPSTSIFGAPAPAGGMFGAPAPAAGNMFGSPPAAAPGGTGGTKVAQYQAMQKMDGTSNITFNSTAGMPQYENKRFEELRVEDYQQGTRNSGGAAASTFGAGGFGAPAPAGGFSSTGFAPAAPAPAFGTTAPAPGFGGFGASPALAPGGFGAAPAPATGLFGAPAPAPATGFGGFGTAAKPPATGGLFGAPTPAPAPSLFGAPAPAPGGLFGGTTPAPAPGSFGAPAPATGGLFGAPAPAPGGLFGAPAPAPAGSSLFGAPAPAPAGGGLFGTSAPAPAFGAAPAPSGFFSGAAPAPGTSLFGAKPASGGLFGAPAPAPGMFGAPAPAPAAAFGAPAVSQAQAAPSMGMFWGNIVPPAEDAVLAQKLAAVDNQKKELERTDVWRGRSPNGSSVTPTSQTNAELALHISPYSASSASLVSYRASPRSMVNIRPRGFGTFSKSPATPDMRNFGRSIASPMKSPESYLGSAHKHLVIKPDAHKPRPSIRLEMTDVPQITDGESKESREEVIRAPATTPLLRSSARPSPPQAIPSPIGITSPPAETANTLPPRSSRKANSSEKQREPVNDSGYDFYQQITSPPVGSGSKKRADKAKGNVLPKLTKTGYAVTPSLEEMALASEADLAAVTGFTVTRAGYASVSWDGAVDVRGVDLDTIVCIEQGDVAVYDAEEANGTKPPKGQKLNRPAIITMQNMFPLGGSDADEEAKDRYQRKIEKLTIKKLGAEFLMYNKSTGEWSFQMPHFSRYRFEDDSSDDEENRAPSDVAHSEDQSAHFGSGERGGRSQGASKETTKGIAKKSVRFREYLEFEKTDEYPVALVADAEMGDVDSRVRSAAASAYSALFEVAQELQESPVAQAPRRDSFFEDEFVDCSESLSEPLPLVRTVVPTNSAGGITARLAKKCGVTSPSNSGTDFGLRMGRSFRVGWRPDGSLVQIGQSSSADATVLQQCVPELGRKDESNTALLSLLQVHLKHSKKESRPPTDCPVFSLPGDSSIAEMISALADSEGKRQNIPSEQADPEQGVILLRAFSLLACLVEGEMIAISRRGELVVAEKEGTAQSLLREQNSINSCRKWLVEACQGDVRVEVQNALSKNDVHSAIFASLSGGDLEQAVSIATSNGHSHLATLIATVLGSPSCIHDQVQQWRKNGSSQYISSELLRIYSLLGGDMRLEEEAFARGESALDWRRRLCMLLSFGENREKSMSSIMERYDQDVVNGVAPYPAPRHMNARKPVLDGSKCVLYKILELVRGNETRHTLSSISSPIGMTASQSDFAGSFHVSMVISAIGCCPPMPAHDEATILDSYAAQLCNDGKWEWAVYVLLCLFGTHVTPAQMYSREQQAKEIVIRNLQSSTDPSKRAFLKDKVGIQSSWFAEAMAHHCAHLGDVKGYVQRLADVSLEQAREALEELVIPNLLFQSTDEIVKSLDLLEPCAASNENSLAAATMHFIVLAQDVMALTSEVESEKSPTDLLQLATSVEQRFVSYRAQLGKRADTSCGLRVYTNYRVVPQEMFLAEALAGVSFLKLQLEALQAGGTVLERDTNGSVHFKVASQLAFLRSKRDVSMAVAATGTANESILQGMI